MCGGKLNCQTRRIAVAHEYLARHSVGLAKARAPEATANRDHGELGANEGAANRVGDLLRALAAETDVAVAVAHGDVSLEAGALTGAGLLLHRGDLHDLVLQLSAKEVIDDLVLLDRHGKEVDLLKVLDLAALDEATELGARVPRLLALLVATAATGAATAAATALAAATTAALAAEAALETTTCSVSRHDTMRKKECHYRRCAR